MSMKLKIKLVSVSILAVFLPLFIICGGCGSKETVPDGSTITINPGSTALQNINGNTPLNFKVVVKYADGSPIPNATIHITGAFAEPAVAANYQFFYYPDGSQRVGGNTEKDNGFDAQTDDFGVYDFSIEAFGPGAAFTDTIYVTSGTAVGTATVSLTTT
jgi:hypothetical protein